MRPGAVLLAGALLGLLAVAVGAASEHVLQGRTDAEGFRYVMTAIRYHQFGALAVTAIGLALLFGTASVDGAVRRRATVAAWLLTAGTVLFSFSIYAAVSLDRMALTYVTPVGGTTLIAGWGALAWAAFAGMRGRQGLQ